MKKSKQKNKLVKAEQTLIKDEATKKTRSKMKSSYGLGAHKMLKAMNPYYKTIEDPFHVTGVKIPDLDIQDSEAFHIRQKYNVPVGSGGLALYVVGFMSQSDGVTKRASLIPKQIDGFGFAASNNDALMTVNNLTAGTWSNAFLPQWGPTTQTVQSKYTHARLVSGGVSFQVLGSTNDAQGKVSAAFFPKNKLDKVRGTGNLTLEIVENQQGAIIVPLNEFKPTMSRYIPIDKSLLEYWPLDESPQNAYDRGNDGSEPGCIVVVVSGAVAAQQLQIVNHMNYEGIVRDSTYSSGGTDDVYVDNVALDDTFRNISNLPSSTTAKSVQYEQSKSGPIAAGKVSTGDSAKHPGSILENMIDSIPTVLEKGVGAVEKMAPLLALI